MYHDISLYVLALYVLAPHVAAAIEIPTHFLATHLKAHYVLTHILLTTEWPNRQTNMVLVKEFQLDLRPQQLKNG